jgi:hypothetical protein
MKSTALGGLTPAKWINPFYDTARRFIGFSPATVDQYLAAGGTAAVAGRVVTLTAEGLPTKTGSVRLGHQGKLTRWADKFNERSAAAG